MRAVQFVCVLCCAISWCSLADAGGFFRRVPEVGEWARYEMTVDSSFGKSDESLVTHTGAMVVKCVGEETIDEQRHLWIEFSCEMKVAADHEFREITKTLVHEDELLTDTLAAVDIRGWQSCNKSDPDELTFSSEDLFHDTGGHCFGLTQARRPAVAWTVEPLS